MREPPPPGLVAAGEEARHRRGAGRPDPRSGHGLALATTHRSVHRYRCRRLGGQPAAPPSANWPATWAHQDLAQHVLPHHRRCAGVFMQAGFAMVERVLAFEERRASS